MLTGMLGTKIGMTRIFDEQGRIIPVTLIKAGPCTVIQVKTAEKDGYNALQLGYGNCKEKNVTKPLLGHFKKANSKPYRWLKEFKINSTDGYQVGQIIKVDNVFSPGDYVDISGITKGKGFQGVVKRYGFSGGPRTHGQSDRLRAPGAIGSQRPQRVLKGKKMAGRMGGVWRTVQKLCLLQVTPEKDMLVVKGNVHGNNGGLLMITKTVKKLKVAKAKPVVEVKRLRTKGKPPK